MNIVHTILGELYVEILGVARILRVYSTRVRVRE